MTTLEIKCQPWISMQTLEGLNFAEINALFFLMGTLHFHTLWLHLGEVVQQQTPTYAPAPPWKIARAHSRPKRVFAA